MQLAALTMGYTHLRHRILQRNGLVHLHLQADHVLPVRPISSATDTFSRSLLTIVSPRIELR